MVTDETFYRWCRRIRASDPEAYEQLFRALHDALFRYARYITSDAATARDIVQDVFLQLWEMRRELDPARSIKSLLYRMVRNAAYNHQRNRRTRGDLLQKELKLAQQDEPVLPDRILSAKRLDERVKTWIDELPERQREALLLSRYEDLSHKEVAEVMDISPRTVNNHLVKALKTLREHICALERTC